MRTSFGAVILAQKITNHYQPVFAFAQLKVANRITTQFSMVVSTNSSLSFSFYHSSTQNRKPFKACGFAFSMMKNEGQRFPFHHPHWRGVFCCDVMRERNFLERAPLALGYRRSSPILLSRVTKRERSRRILQQAVARSFDDRFASTQDGSKGKGGVSYLRNVTPGSELNEERCPYAGLSPDPISR